ncbi:MAG: BlaI/MecI/CopY family transcriptional regulator [Flavonifractor plautii]
MKLSDKEWRVLNALWVAPEGLALGAVVDALRPDTGWSRSTVLTYLTRMEAKGLVDIRKEDFPHRYRAAVSREDCAAAERRGLLERAYQGSAGKLVAAFLKDEKLTPQERDELREAAGRDGGVRRGQPLVCSRSDPGPVRGGVACLARRKAPLSGQALPPVAVRGVGHPGPARPPARRSAGPHPGARRAGGAGGRQAPGGTPPVLRPHRPLRRDGGTGPGAPLSPRPARAGEHH